MRQYLLLVALFLPFITQAGIVKGKVLDQSGTPLAFATIAVEGSTIGTTSNEEGAYQLDIPTGKSIILNALYIGFETNSITLSISVEPQIINFNLVPQKYNLDEVNITIGEDPAYAKMRQVIQHKQEHRKLISSLESDVYLKEKIKLKSFPKKLFGQEIKEEDLGLTIDEDGNHIAYLLEQYSKYYFKKPNKELTNIISVRQSGDPKGLGFANLPTIIDIYDNNVLVMEGVTPRGVISPAHDNAFYYYKFKFLGTFFQGDKMISKIEVTPKRKNEPLFKGTVYVVENDWVFQSISLSLNKESQLNMLDSLYFEQKYLLKNNKQWLIQNQIMNFDLKILGIAFDGFYVTDYGNLKYNEPINDTIFKNKISSIYETTALDRDTSLWNDIRPIPLSNDEIKDYKIKDSIYVNTLSDSAILQNTRANLGFSDFMLGGASYKFKRHSFALNPIISMVNYNTVEGVHINIAPKYTLKLNTYKDLTVSFLNRYGFANKRNNPSFSIKYNANDEFWKTKNWNTELQIGSFVNQFNQDAGINPYINMLYTLFANKNYMKLYENKMAKIKYHQNLGNGLNLRAAFSYEARSPLYNSTDYTFYKENNWKLTPNYPSDLGYMKEHEAAIIQIGFDYQFGVRYIQQPVNKVPYYTKNIKVGATYTKAIPGIINSESDFDKWDAYFNQDINLKLRGNLKYQIAGGGFLTKKMVTQPDMKHLNGNQTFLANTYLNSFQVAPYYSFSNTASLYGQLNAEWHLNGFLTNKIPGFNRLNYHLIIGTNSFVINKEDYYTEFFVGLENVGFKIYRPLRIDFVAGYNSQFSKPVYGLRLGLGGIFSMSIQ